MAMIEKTIVKNPQATFRVTCSTLAVDDELGRAFEVDIKGICSASEVPKGDMILLIFYFFVSLIL
jgi:hypothetical protein